MDKFRFFRSAAEKKENSLSENERRLAERIESFPAKLDSDSVNIILVWRGLKPAAEVPLILGEWDESGYSTADARKEKELRSRARDLFDALGLAHKESPAADFSENWYDEERGIVGGEIVAWFFISRDGNLADRLAGIWPKRYDQEKYYAEFGKLFGFPESAVKSYGEHLSSMGGGETESVMDLIKSLPKNVSSQNFVAFAQFRLSREHWREELKTAEDWAKEIRGVDPSLYARVVADYHRRLAGGR